MPGNEIAVIKYLFGNRGIVALPHIGVVTTIGRPGKRQGQIIPIEHFKDIALMSSDNAHKKADVYINGIGVSIKQTGGDFKFNRLQRANLKKLFESFGLSNVDQILSKLDSEVDRFHHRDETSSNRMLRNRPWREFFTEKDFRKVLEILMLKQNPNYGISDHPAELLLYAPKEGISSGSIRVYTFPEYFDENVEKFMIAIRRVWYGQKGGEHDRARGLITKLGNAPWVYDSVAGRPRHGWRASIPESERKTVYLLFIA